MRERVSRITSSALIASGRRFAFSGLEEYYWRWFVFGHLRQFVSARTAVLVSSAAFTAHHAIVVGSEFRGAWGMTVFACAGVALGGAVWARLYERSGSLVGPWLSHALVDAALMMVGYELLWPLR